MATPGSASDVDLIIKQIKQQREEGSVDLYNEIIEKLVSMKFDKNYENTSKQREASKHKIVKRFHSGDFEKNNFALTKLEVKTLLDIVERRPGSRATSTTCWNQPSSRRTAVYKLCKVTRWLLKDEDMIFDPLHRSEMVTVASDFFIDDVCGLVKANPEDSAQPCVHQIRSLSVNYILSQTLTAHSAKTLREIDNALSLLDMSTQDDISNKGKIAEIISKLAHISNDEKIAELVLRNQNLKSASATQSAINADTSTKLSAISWMQDLINYIILKLYEKKPILEEPYTLMFQDFIALILQAVAEKKDKYTVKPSTVPFGRRFDMKMNDLHVSSEADLYICHEEIVKTVDTKFPKHSKLCEKPGSLIAVVEVKGRDAVGNISDSSGTSPGLSDENVDSMKKTTDAKTDVISPSCKTSEGHTEEKEGTKKKVKQRATKHVCFLGETTDTDTDEEVDDSDDAKEADEDVPDFDDLEERKVDSPPNDNLRIMNQDEKLALRYFLPQLLGELMCTFNLPNRLCDRTMYHGTYRLGIAVTGLLIHFVAFIIRHKDDEFPQHETSVSNRNPYNILHEEHLRTVCFLTRPLDILKKEDRRIIIKTLAAAALLTSA